MDMSKSKHVPSTGTSTSKGKSKEAYPLPLNRQVGYMEKAEVLINFFASVFVGGCSSFTPEADGLESGN